MFPQVVCTPWHFNAGVDAVDPSIASFRTRVGAWPQAMSVGFQANICSLRGFRIFDPKRSLS